MLPSRVKIRTAKGRLCGASTVLSKTFTDKDDLYVEGTPQSQVTSAAEQSSALAKPETSAQSQPAPPTANTTTVLEQQPPTPSLPRPAGASPDALFRQFYSVLQPLQQEAEKAEKDGNLRKAASLYEQVRSALTRCLC